MAGGEAESMHRAGSRTDGSSGPPGRAAPEADAVLLRATGLCKTFRRGGLLERGTETRALDQVGFSLAAGGSLGVVGESGSGKSTLLRTILRLLPYDAGSLHFAGMEIAGMNRAALGRFRRRVQPVFQDPYSTFNPRFSIGSSIGLGIPGPGGEARREAVDGLLGEVGLDPELRRALPHELSGGQRQRAAIARALAVRPDLLLLDEPTSALDVSVQAQVLNLFRELQERFGFSLILVTHDLPVVRFLCDRVLVMQQGRVVEAGPTAAVVASPETEYTARLVAAAPELPE